MNDEQDLEVAELCGRDPRAQQIRAALFRVERQGGDWDSDPLPRIFAVFADADSPRVAVQYGDLLTDAMRMMMETNGGNAGAAIVTLAEAAEAASQSVRAISSDCTDLLSGRSAGWRFYGLGLRSEAWMVRAARRIDEHPDRVELRVVYLADRASRFWTLTRVRGEEPKAALYQSNDLPYRAAGSIPFGLARFVNATVVPPPCPGCPACGEPPLWLFDEGRQAFCGTDGCEVVSWDPTLPDGGPKVLDDTVVQVFDGAAGQRGAE